MLQTSRRVITGMMMNVVVILQTDLFVLSISQCERFRLNLFDLYPIDYPHIHRYIYTV